LDVWYQHLRELWQYKQEYGDCRVSQSYENQQLANWVRNQRSRVESLSLDQVDALNQLGFEWRCTPRPAEKRFPSYFSAKDKPTRSSAAGSSHPPSGEGLAGCEIDYSHSKPASRKGSEHARNGQSSAVASESASPAEESQVSTFSRKRDAVQLTNEPTMDGFVRLEPLPREIAAAGKKYVASVSTVDCSFLCPDVCRACYRSARVKSDLYAWYQQLRELWRYKQEYGSCHVQRTNNRALADWVRRQRLRKDLVAFPLSQDQVDALNQIGFEWSGAQSPAHTELQASSTVSNLHRTKKQRPVAPSADAYNVGSSSNLQDFSQSKNATSLRALVRLEPLPREIEAAEAR
jgi:Helicase associated domain